MQALRHGADQLGAEAGALGRRLGGHAAAVVFDREQEDVVAVAAQQHADLTADAVRIGVFARVGDEFGDDHAQRHRLVGRQADRFGDEVQRVRAIVARQRFVEFVDQRLQVIVHVDAFDVVRRIQPAVDLRDRADAALRIVQRGARGGVAERACLQPHHR